ncbi:MAG: PIN domain-containing protein [Candidatus Riflebacteria bacterium]|nr:PIN domain-containing protein [Candidatus Riflebacteria bacterium]
MGSVTVPTSCPIYVDANVVIYAVAKHPRHGPALSPLWVAMDAGSARAISSELILLETLVGPYRSGLNQLVADYEAFLGLPGIQLVPVSRAILREAARLRASVPRLRSPDAIHAATALLHGVASFVTNDPVFRAVPGLHLVLLDEVVDSGPGALHPRGP